MKTVTVQPGQTLFDIAVQVCGNTESAFVIAELNNVPVTNVWSGAVLEVPEPVNKKVVDYYENNKIMPATAFEEEILNYNNMGLKIKTLNYNLSQGDTSTDSISLDGGKAVVSVGFSAVTGSGLNAKLQQSIDGDAWGDVPGSTATIETGQTVQFWNVFGLPKDILLRVVLSTNMNTGYLTTFKILSNG